MTLDPRGYYRKFRVIRTDNDEEIEADTFTLIPEDDPHALPALRAYADSVESVNAELAADLRRLVEQHT